MPRSIHILDFARFSPNPPEIRGALRLRPDDAEARRGVEQVEREAVSADLAGHIAGAKEAADAEGLRNWPDEYRWIPKLFLATRVV